MKFSVIGVHVVVNIENRVAVAMPTERADFVIIHPTVFLLDEVGGLNVKGAFAYTAPRAVSYELRHHLNILL
jgi:hypothetical protein